MKRQTICYLGHRLNAKELKENVRELTLSKKQSKELTLEACSGKRREKKVKTML